MPAALIATASTGFVGATGDGRATASATCSEVALTVGAKSTMSASTRGSAHGRQRPRRRGHRAAEHVDGVLDAALQPAARRQRRDGLVCEARLEPGGLAGVGAQGCRARPRS